MSAVTLNTARVSSISEEITQSSVPVKSDSSAKTHKIQSIHSEEFTEDELAASSRKISLVYIDSIIAENDPPPSPNDRGLNCPLMAELLALSSGSSVLFTEKIPKQ